MNRTKEIPLHLAITGLTLSIALLGLGGFALSASLVVDGILQKTTRENLGAAHSILADSMANDVMAGLDSEIYRKCRLFFESGGVEYIRVSNPTGHEYCLFRIPDRHRRGDEVSLTTPIFFDESRSSIAATIETTHFVDGRRALLRKSLMILGATTFALLVLLVWPVRLVSRALSEPIRRLSSIMDLPDTASISAALQSGFTGWIVEVNALGKKASEMAARLRALEISRERDLLTKAQAELAGQVAHDIRSPLAALALLTKQRGGWDKVDMDLADRAVSRIRQIADDLLDNERRPRLNAQMEASGPEHASCEVSRIALDVTAEKRLNLPPRVTLDIFVPDSGPLRVLGSETEVARLLSNLIDNSVQALGPSGGRVEVSVTPGDDGSIVLQVKDDGKGIPPEILPLLGQRGATFGKNGGNGLGLHHARMTLEKNGGALRIESRPGVSTVVSAHFRGAAGSHASHLELTARPGDLVLLLDDDEAMHELWQKRFLQEAPSVRLAHARSAAEFRARATEAVALYLLDYDIGDASATGLSLCAEVGACHRAVLITGRHTDSGVAEQCRSLGVRLHSKDEIRNISIRLVSGGPTSPPDAILIEDDALVRKTWSLSASRSGKALRDFRCLEDFIPEASSVPRSTPIFLDFELTGGADGAVAIQRLRDLGFAEIHLETGHSPDSLPPGLEVQSLRGKEPPWG